jgi:RNA polymerase sigma-70 factor (ECF subfamily)
VCLQGQEHLPAAVSFDDERTRGKAMPSAPDRQFGDLELRDRLEKAIARLPANYRLLIAAHYLNGVQYEGLAEALQLPLGTVKTQLYRAKRQLRRMLETDLK